MSSTPADNKRGAQLFMTRCGHCHTASAGQPHKSGPNLYGVLGRKAGSANGYDYSAALVDKGVIWNERTLSEYVENPTKYVPGTKMTYGAMKKADEREEIIAYLKAEARRT